MRVLVRLLLSAFVVYASGRVGLAYWDWYRFRDAAQAVAQFAGDAPEAEVKVRVLEVASTLRLPLEAEQISVRRVQTHTFIDAAYVYPIELLPSYQVPWKFAVNVDAWTASMPKAGDPIPGVQ
jgi:hypothetical protein